MVRLVVCLVYDWWAGRMLGAVGRVGVAGRVGGCNQVAGCDRADPIEWMWCDQVVGCGICAFGRQLRSE